MADQNKPPTKDTVSHPRKPVIVPLKPHFESLRALLARIAEDADDIDAMVITVFRKDDGMAVPMHFQASRYQYAFASVMWGNMAIEGCAEPSANGDDEGA